jgi:mannosyltransferase
VPSPNSTVGSPRFPAAPVGRRELWALGGITLLAAVVRFATLDLQSYQNDEAVTAGKVLLPDLFDTLREVAEGERSPPLYYLIAWLWAQPFGTGEVGLRSLSAIVGTLTVPSAWLAARELVSARVALLAAALVAISPYLVWFSQEARSYSFLVLFSTLALAFFARSLRAPSKGAFAAWALMSALALCSHYFAAFVIAPQALWLLWSMARAHRQVIPAVAAVGLVALALAPLALAQEGEGRGNAFADRPLAGRVVTTVVNYVASERPNPFRSDWPVDLVRVGGGVAAGAVFVVAVVLLLRRGTERERWGATVAGALGAAAILIPFALGVVGLDFLKPRNLVAGVVPLLIMVAAGLGGERSGLAGRIAAAVACASFAGVLIAVTQNGQMQRADWRGAAEAMGSPPRTRIVVTHHLGDAPLEYYLEAGRFDGKRFPDGLRVRNIEVVSITSNITSPRGFRLASERRLPPRFFLYRFESGRPQLVKPEDLSDSAVLPKGGGKALIDPP